MFLRGGVDRPVVVVLAHRGYVPVHDEIAFESTNVAELENNEMVKNLYLGA